MCVHFHDVQNNLLLGLIRGAPTAMYGTCNLMVLLQIQELKRKVKQPPAHVPVKKGESPIVSRKITDSSPKSLRKVGSGDKGTPSGSPAENRSVSPLQRDLR